MNFKIEKLKELYNGACRFVNVSFAYPTKRTAQASLFLIGFVILVVGLDLSLHAQPGGGGFRAQYNDTRIAEAAAVVLRHIEGSFGALIMIASGIGAIMAAAFGNFKASLALLVVSIGAFILRSLVGTFFNTQNIESFPSQ
ncbi:MAG TPA: hypothetical protein PKD37_07000 [Oligoflexia bacterium]|nr:hypothetical protein [Oligoflexia bacterium]HMP27710.1 hypothetical protein [Oligoflexia bacterium]